MMSHAEQQLVSAEPTPSRKGAYPFLGWIVGALFAIQWAIALVLFPLYKDRPIGFVPVVLGVIFGGLLCLASVGRSVTTLLVRPSRRVFLILLLVVALGLRLLVLVLIPLEPLRDPAFAHGYAVNLLAGLEYGGEGHRAFFPPGMSFLLAGWYAITTPALWSGKLLNVLLGTLFVLLGYDLARRLTGEAAGRWAAGLTTLMPTLLLCGATLDYKVALGCVLIAVADLALVARRQSPVRSLVLAALMGGLLGFGSLIKPICLVIPLFLLVSWWVQGMRGRAIACSLLATACLVAVVCPWTIRNYRVFGEVVPISTNGGVVLYNANNPESAGGWMNPTPLPGEVDEVSRDRVRSRAALEWIRDNPGRWSVLAVAKCVYTWGTSSSVVATISLDRLPRWQENAWIAFVNVFWAALFVWFAAAALSGTLIADRNYAFTLLLLAFTFALHLFFEASSVHHIPVVFAMIIPGAAWLAGCGSDRSPNPSIPGATVHGVT